MNFAITHRGHGGEGHVEGVERRVMVDEDEAYGPGGQRGQRRPAGRGSGGQRVIGGGCSSIAGSYRWRRAALLN